MTTVTFFTRSLKPCFLEVRHAGQSIQTVPFHLTDDHRESDECCWIAKPLLKSHGEWEFRIEFNDGTYAAPYNLGSFENYRTSLDTLWVQNGQIFDYLPENSLTDSTVVKVPNFIGSLPKRPLYVYLPRGYFQHPDKTYPVIYMHDGQNVFERFNTDSYAGSFRADEVADRLIRAGQMPECIIVGISNGGGQRIAEYLPDYVELHPHVLKGERPMTQFGQADRTARYYIHDVAPYIERNFRASSLRSQRATCGSSMGGLFSAFLGWEYPQFAAQHACMSPSFWITGDLDNEYADQKTVERFRHGDFRPIRLYLDSGTGDNSSDSDDGMHDTVAARDALLENGYTLGDNLVYRLDEGAGHNEAAWANRLPEIFKFLMPFENQYEKTLRNDF